MVKSYYAGMELDAPCGRCKSETTHRILSITEGVPEKLLCIACGATHKFRESKPSAPTPARAPRTAAGVAKPKPTPASPSRFQELMIEERAGTHARAYSAAERWEAGMWIDHPLFGLGKVQHRAGRKIDVLFREGVKTLLSA